MAQAQIALETSRAPSALWLRMAAFMAGARERHEQKRMLARMIAERELGHATGARV